MPIQVRNHSVSISGRYGPGCSGIRKKDQGYWLGQRPAASPEKLLDLISLGGHICEFGVDRIYEQHDFHGRIGRCGRTRYGLKRHDLLGLFVVQERKVLLCEAGDRLSGLIGHHHIERHLATRTNSRDRCRRFGLPRGSILLCPSGNQRKAEYVDPTAASRTHVIHLTRANALHISLSAP